MRRLLVFVSSGARTDVTPLTRAYDADAERTAQHRVVLAGYRLADQLQEPFKKP